MDLNLLLWSGGTLFSLGIFAVKTGTGLGYGRISRKGIALTLGLYLLLFELLALLAGQVLALLEPLLKGGPWLHGGMALGMIIWGGWLLRKPGAVCTPGSSLALLIPCPVCLTAMTFSTWTALNSLPLLPWAVGLVLGSAFSVMTLLILFITRARNATGSVHSLGLAMITIGLYFIASLFLPAKVEQAKGMYGSFMKELQPAATGGNNAMLLAGVLAVALLAGFFLHKGDTK